MSKFTIEEVSNWPDERLKEQCAIYLGWTDVQTNKFGVGRMTGVPPTASGLHHDVSDYPHSLDACSWFSVSFGLHSDRLRFMMNVWRVLGHSDISKANYTGYEDLLLLHQAKPRQLCIAFIVTNSN